MLHLLDTSTAPDTQVQLGKQYCYMDNHLPDTNKINWLIDWLQRYIIFTQL